jgi:hypothetical protein
MVPLQKRVNGIDAQIILNRKTLLNPWVLAPKGSGLNPGQVAMRPGATILYNFIGVGMAPQVVQGVALPAQIMEERQQAIQAMDSLAQDAAAGAQAAMPQGVKSGIALNFMREQQQELAIPRLKRWGLWIAERDRKRLLLAQRYYTEPRAIKLMGQGSDWQVHYWQGTDLRGNTDVTVDPGTLMPKSQSLKAQTIFDALDQQLIDVSDPVNRQKLIEELGIGEAFDTAIGPDRRRAQKENAQMDEGMPAQMTPWEDKQVHLAEHLSRMKDPSFDSLSQASQQLYMMHMQETQQAISQEAQQQEQEQLQQTAWTARAQSGEDVDTLALSTTEGANGSQPS